jgi:hypothetical protein
VKTFAKVCVVLPLLMSVGRAGAQNFELKDYAAIRAASGFQEYIGGVGSGFSWANAWLKETRNQPPLYCVPAKLALSRENYLDILDRQVREHGDRRADTPVALMLLDGLVETFPCK